MQGKKLKWKSDFDKSVLIENFVNRGWVKASDKEEDSNDWNVYWATVWTVRNIFNPKTGTRLNDQVLTIITNYYQQQVLNHFPNHYELTRKDLMVKNIKRFKKEIEKENNILAARDEMIYQLSFDFIPQTYVLPGEYSLFVEEFHRNPNLTWIVKPASRSQGKGIFLLRKIHQLKKISAPNQQLNSASTALNLANKENFVVSRYVDNPLLIGGKKFDLRLYVLVTSYKPLRVWSYDKGFGRFCNELYTSDIAEMDNMFVHLTNVAIQQYSDKYSDTHGGKWALKSLRFYIESAFGTEAQQKMHDDISQIIITSLRSVQSVMINDKHCFEMYGFDILLDSNLKPWLIEVNASPSLSTTTKTDKDLKMNLINDVYRIVLPDDTNESEIKANQSNRVGGFSILYDETQEQNPKKSIQKRNNLKIWK